MTNAKNYSFLESSNFHYYKELVIKVAGDEDWEKSAGMYVKRYKEYAEYQTGEESIIEVVSAVKSENNERGYNVEKDSIESIRKYLNKSLQNGLKFLQETGTLRNDIKKPGNFQKNALVVNLNIAGIVPGWATTRKIKGARVVSFVTADGITCSVTYKNPVTNELPTDSGNRLYIEIERIFLEQGCPPSNTVEFFNTDLLKRLGKTDAGHYYKQLKEDLLKLRHTEIFSDKVYRFKDSNGQVDYIPGLTSFNMISGVEFVEDGGRGGKVKTRVILNHYFANSLRNRYYKLINAKLEKLLETPTEYNLVLHLEKQRGAEKKLFWSEEINSLCDFIGIVTNDLEARTKTLRKTCESLKNKEYLSAYKFEDKYILFWFCKHDPGEVLKEIV
jgi:hypothetical protein